MTNTSNIEVRNTNLNDIQYDFRKKGTIRIPPFQREYVWEPRRVKDLFDSIYRKFPIGRFFGFMKKILVLQIIGSLVYGGYFWMCLLTSKDFHFIDTVNLIFHEAGHAIFFFLPELLVALAGSVFQILVPLSFVIYFYKRKEYLSACLLVFWLAQNINSVSLYVRDAIPMQLPLLGGEGSVHDWNYIFSTLNMLELSTLCANILLFIAYFSAAGVTLLILEHFMVSIKAKRKEVVEVHEETKID